LQQQHHLRLNDMAEAHFHQPSEPDQIVVFETPDLYHRSLESNDIQYKSREVKKAICCRSEQVVERLQQQHHVRLNEMAEASARIAQQKEDEILRLTHHMQVPATPRLLKSNPVETGHLRIEFGLLRTPPCEPTQRLHTVDYDPFIKSQLASRN